MTKTWRISFPLADLEATLSVSEVNSSAPTTMSPLTAVAVTASELCSKIQR